MNSRRLEIVRDGGKNRILNYTEYLVEQRPRRVLLSYLTDAVIASDKGVASLRFSNDGIAKTWPRVLNELGFVVDIINYNDTSFKPTHSYDLAVLHGAHNFSSLSRYLPKTPLVHFTTGSYWVFNNTQEANRLKNFEGRNGLRLPADREISASEDLLNDVAVGIIGLGNNFTRETYRAYPNVRMINNATYPDKQNKLGLKRFIIGRRKFVFFAGGGNIHKGLDVTIEAFKDLDADLYIVTPLEEPVVNFYKKQGIGSNIHFVDQVDLGSPTYYEVMSTCSFAILPSCSEGQPGSILDCMQAGILPIVSRECGIDSEDTFRELHESSISEIKSAVLDAMGIGFVKHLLLSLKTRRAAIAKYSPVRFQQSLKQALEDMLHVK